MDYHITRLAVVCRRGRTLRTRGRRRVLQALHWASCTPSTCSRHDCRVRGDTSQGAVALREGRCRGRVWRHADDVRGRAWHLDAASRLVELGISMRHQVVGLVASPRVSWVCFTISTFTFYVHLSSLCVWPLSFAFCLYNVIFYMWLIVGLPRCCTPPSPVHGCHSDA